MAIQAVNGQDDKSDNVAFYLASAAIHASQHGGGIGWVLDGPASGGTISGITEWFRARMADPLITVFADWHGLVYGSVQLVRHDGFHAAAARHRASVEKLFVVPGSRGRGLGRRLMEVLITNACAEGLEQLTLDVRNSPEQAAARALYSSLGFVEFGWQSNYASVNGKKYDGVYMSLDLTT
jgi:ribosomal protein S18 acetylase RimI-like enzyme